MVLWSHNKPIKLKAVHCLIKFPIISLYNNDKEELLAGCFFFYRDKIFVYFANSIIQTEFPKN